MTSRWRAGRWHLFSLPCNPADPAPELLFPPGTPLDGNLTRYEDGGYVTYQSFDPDEFGPLRSGEGYWLHTDASIGVSYVACCPVEPQELHYPAGGWHLLGSHRLEAIPFSIISARSSTGQVLSFEQAWLSGWVGDPLFLYSFADLGYLSVGVNFSDEEDFLRPRYGYWFSTGMPNLTLIIPPP